jgi:ADP-ribose pyrophosphatase
VTGGPHEGAPADPPAFPPFERLRSERIYDSPWVGLRRDVLRAPRGGGEREYHVVEIGDAVAVVPVLEDGSVVLVGQYRYPHGRTHWEVPAGRLHPGEPPEEGARRELLEECGCAPAALEPLPGFFPVNGISAHYAHLFVARGCRRVAEPRLDDLEQLVVGSFARAEVERLVDSGRIQDGFSALALLRWLRGS